MPAISTPSYSSCAAFIVRLAWKPSLRDASCCSVEVMNGGAGCLFFLPFLTESTRKSAVSSTARIASACSLFVILISPLRSP